MQLSVIVVDRNPAAAGAPTLLEVAPLTAVSGFELTETLNLPAALRLTVPSGLQEDAVRQRFADLTQAVELHVHDNDSGTQLFAGPVLGYQPKSVGGELAWDITTASLLDYPRRWRIEPDGSDLTFVGVDQALIAKALVDYYQALAYGHYGIVTSAVAATGVVRDRTYLAKEAHLIAQRLSELAAVDNGFDFDIDAATRQLRIYYPRRGIDRSATVIIDRSDVIDPSAQLSVGPEDICSEGFAVSTDTGLVGHATNAAMRASYGRTSFATAYSGISDAPTINAHATRLVTERSTYLHVPAAKTYPIGYSWDSFTLGDTVEYAYDYGAGLIVEHRRVLSRVLSVDVNGAETIEVGFK
jgi:hypothetical protein